MTGLLQRAIKAIEKLSSDEQDAIASLILDELEDEQAWKARFEATSDEQWESLAEAARREIASGETTPLDPVFPIKDSSP